MSRFSMLDVFFWARVPTGQERMRRLTTILQFFKIVPREWFSTPAWCWSVSNYHQKAEFSLSWITYARKNLFFSGGGGWVGRQMGLWNLVLLQKKLQIFTSLVDRKSLFAKNTKFSGNSPQLMDTSICFALSQVIHPCPKKLKVKICFEKKM